jgi:hypothetical protein
MPDTFAIADRLPALIVFLTTDRASCGLANGAAPPMQRSLPTLLGLALGLSALAGCVQPPPRHAICPAFTTPPPVPPPAAMVTPPPPVWAPPWHHVAIVADAVHRIVRHQCEFGAAQAVQT